MDHFIPGLHTVYFKSLGELSLAYGSDNVQVAEKLQRILVTSEMTSKDWNDLEVRDRVCATIVEFQEQLKNPTLQLVQFSELDVPAPDSDGAFFRGACLFAIVQNKWATSSAVPEHNTLALLDVGSQWMLMMYECAAMKASRNGRRPSQPPDFDCVVNPSDRVGDTFDVRIALLREMISAENERANTLQGLKRKRVEDELEMELANKKAKNDDDERRLRHVPA